MKFALLFSIVASSPLAADVSNSTGYPDYIIFKSDKYNNGDRKFVNPKTNCDAIPEEDAQYNKFNIPEGLEVPKCVVLACGPDKPSFFNLGLGFNAPYIKYCYDRCFKGVYCTNDFLQSGGPMCGCRGYPYDQ